MHAFDLGHVADQYVTYYRALTVHQRTQSPKPFLNPVADRHPGSRERVGLETIEVQSLEALRREVVEALTIGPPGRNR